MRPMLLAATLTLCIAHLATAQQPPTTRVVTVDVHRADGGGFVEGAATYRYRVTDIPAARLAADAAARDVLYGARLSFRCRGLRPQARYELRVSLLSDCDDRIVRFQSLDEVVEASLQLPDAEIIERRFVLRGDDTGCAEFVMQCVGGPNVPVAAIEVWSDDPTPLQAPSPLREALQRVDVAWPRLSPRPATVAGVSTPTIQLDGEWRFRPAVDAAWSTIDVPGEWEMQGFTVAPGHAAEYARTVRIPDDWAGKVVRLRFAGVHSTCSVEWNGQPLGLHDGGFVPFELDATSAVRPGDNSLVVKVISESITDTLASASQYAAHPLGGITRKVELFALPAVHAVEAVLDADYDPTTRTGLLRADVTLSGHGAVRLLLAGETPLDHTTPVSDGHATVTLQIPGVVAWDPEHPRLHELTVQVLDERGGVETFVRRLGFRRVEVQGNRVLVNGMPIKLKGACRHEVHPLRGRSLTPALCEQDAQLFVDANCNYVRTSHYPPSEEFLDACDRLGLFVECEAAVCWVAHGANGWWSAHDPNDPTLLAPMLRANLDNVAANRHHPSVLLWSLANESRWSPLFAEINRRVKRADPTRPTSFHDQCWGDYNNEHSEADVAVYHYPDENGPAKCNRETRPVLFGEYCHVQCYNRRELVTDPGVRDDWGRGFARMSDLMYASDGCLGGAIWAAIDDVFCMPDGRTIGYGPWGAICDGWRRAKPETDHVRQVYAPLRVELSAAREDGGDWVVPIENRFDFTDLSELRIEWAEHGNVRRIPLALPPHARGELRLPVSPQGARLTITGTDGRVLLATGDPVPMRPPEAAAAAADAEWRLDGERITAGTIGGSTVVVDGPDFMLLPLQNEECEPTDLALAQPLVDIADAKVATGRCELRADGATLHVRYDFVAAADVNPRQWGVVLWLARDCERLAWTRERTAEERALVGDWFQQGDATPRLPAVPLPYLREQPQQPWALDATPLGGNAFSATRTRLQTLSLRAANGRGVQVAGHGELAARAFVQGDRIGLLLAGFHTGGGDQFFAPHFAAERRPLKQGDHMAGECAITLIGR